MTRGKGAAALAAALLGSLPVACLAGVTVEKTNGGVATVARMPIAPRLSFRAHVGSVPNRPGPEASPPSWLGGAGLEYRLSRGLRLGAGWEHFSRRANPDAALPGLEPGARSLPMLDTDRFAIGFSYRF